MHKNEATSTRQQLLPNLANNDCKIFCPTLNPLSLSLWELRNNTRSCIFINYYGWTIREMDDTCSNNMDTGFHRYKLWLLLLLLRPQIGSGDFSGAAQLSVYGLWYGQGIGLVFWGLPFVFSHVGGHFHGCLYGIIWLWPPMARHSEIHLFALFPGQLF